jgi:ketosteroid isomerase-like protein
MSERSASDPEAITALLAAIDTGDLSAAARHVSEDVTVVLGNSEPLVGVSAFIERVGQFTAAFLAVLHEIHHVWQAANDADVVIATMTSHYTTKDGRHVRVAGCNVVRMDGAQIADLGVYTDASPVLDAG